ncbi:MAG: hypothetical protein GY764_05280 [Halieaceae bacterium]|nr:hypothetical protein [Halieaceae bacterium]
MTINTEFLRAIRNKQYETTDDGRMLLPKQKVHIGGVFTHDVRRDGVLLGEQSDGNIVVNEGLDHILDVAFHGITATPTWYIGIFEGNYTPIATVTAATITAASTESTAYDETYRVEWVEAAAASQSITNSASKATFTMNDTKTIYGAFLISDRDKSDTAGVLAAASAFSASRSLVATDELLVTYTLSASDA